MTIEGIIWTGNKLAQKSYSLILVIQTYSFTMHGPASG
jgi:hypothetical protein